MTLAAIASKTRERIERRLTGLPAWARWSLSAYPPGHYHSPLPDVSAALREPQLPPPEQVPAVDVRRDAQLGLLEKFEKYRADMPFRGGHQEHLRYWLANDWFAHGDGVALYSMLRHVQPKRYVEVGSGFSSACALDTADRFLQGVQFTFFEPNPERLRRMLKTSDEVDLITQIPTHYEPKHFAMLEAGDVLFIDSSHVVKYGSEVNDLLLDVVPQLPAGVHVHVHDIFWPFSYPREWIRRRWAWNEAYLLRGLLCGNSGLQINWFNSYLGRMALEQVAPRLPEWGRDPGSSIWLERV